MWSPPRTQSPVAADQSEPRSGGQNSALLFDKKKPPLQKERSSAATAELNGPPIVQEQAAPERTRDVDNGELPVPNTTKPNLSWLAFYVFSEVAPETKPADTILDALKDIPLGTPIEEIKRIADVLGLDFTFMKTVAKIESSFNPNARTGSYIGLFQISNYEFGKFGSGDIRGSRDNTVAAAIKMTTEAMMFEMFTRRKPTLNDMYLIHQQGVEGAAEHIRHPGRLAWRSMCATQEGKEKGEKWCKRAIWGNTLPVIKRIFKSVNKVTSADFVNMWQQRMAHFYAQYSEAIAN